MGVNIIGYSYEKIKMEGKACNDMGVQHNRPKNTMGGKSFQWYKH